MNVIVAVTGASGSIYAKLLLDELHRFQSKGDVKQIDVIFSNNAKEVWKHEIVDELGQVHVEARLALAHPNAIYNNDDYNAPFASGSALYDVMFVCPCSMGTMGRIANGLSDTLISRAADVMLKERRKLILAIRETPINLIHVNNMQTLAQAGAIIAPASPSFYSNPKTIEEVAMTVVDRLLQLGGLNKEMYRWGDIGAYRLRF